MTKQSSIARCLECSFVHHCLGSLSASSKTVRRGGRQEGEKQEGLQDGFRLSTVLTSLLTQGLAARAGCADQADENRGRKTDLIFFFR